MGSPLMSKPTAAEVAAANAAKWERQKAAAAARGSTLADPPAPLPPTG